VASSGSHQGGLSRRKPSSSSLQQQTGSTRIIYRESTIHSESELPIWQRNWFIAFLFIMALGFFALAIFLFLTLDPDVSPSSTASASAASSEGVEVFHFFTLCFFPISLFRVRDLVNLVLNWICYWLWFWNFVGSDYLWFSD